MIDASESVGECGARLFDCRDFGWRGAAVGRLCALKNPSTALPRSVTARNAIAEATITDRSAGRNIRTGIEQQTSGIVK
jgi:hypothetical protein